MNNKILLAEQTFETLMKSVIMYIPCRIHYAKVIPTSYRTYDNWLNGGTLCYDLTDKNDVKISATTIEDESSEYLIMHYYKALRTYDLANYYKLRKKAKYYKSVVDIIKSELVARMVSIETDPEVYNEK